MGEAPAGRRRWVWLVAAVVLALIGYGVVYALDAGATEKPKAAPTAMVDRGDVTTEVATIGTVQPAQTRSLAFTVAGTVQSVSVRPGTTVTPGQTLAKVDDTDAAKAVDDAQQALNEAEDALTQARAASKPAVASSGCGPNVPAAYNATAATPVPSVSSARPAPSVSSARPAPSASAVVSPSPSPAASPGRTRARTPAPTPTCGSTGGQQGGSGPSGVDPIFSAEERVTQTTTTLEDAEDALDGTTITAPISGRIMSIAGKVGTQVTAGSAFITLADVSDMQIRAEFPEADADRLAVKQKAEVTLADLPGTQFPATVVQVDPTGVSDGTMVRYGVLLAFVDAPDDLLVGQSASVRVTTGNRSGVLRVPSTAVHDVHGDSGTVLKQGAHVKVGVGLRGDQYTEITSGLTDGDRVVTSW
jgi:multidrug efflux pump subunit AcrA (membrane-fusion protein)